MDIKTKLDSNINYTGGNKSNYLPPDTNRSDKQEKSDIDKIR